ncbi:PRC-barrel domain protein [Asanoa ferruginea]|uniref:PRC-barrel domain protein n=1 Tax=Asanoa ferruginea TaxID=53367 RepID=A0A3D9ZNQ1_9ACTN|nr:PRC-barrel domain-containing protein [Asanoa ferruginea]REF98489.1 PRC-barrel domain protein [Asanoa ferruginea]
MFDSVDIREWQGEAVVDPEGNKIGNLESVYLDTATDEPTFATVTIGMPTRHRAVFVPLAGANVGPGYVKVTAFRDQVKNAPSIPDGGELPASNEPSVFAHYDLEYVQGSSGERRLARG